METIIEKETARARPCEYESSINYKLNRIEQYKGKIRSLSAKIGDLISLCSISENKSRLQLLQKQLTFLYIKLSMAASDLRAIIGTCPSVDDEVIAQELLRIEGVVNDFLQFFRFTSIALQRLTRLIRASERLRSILLN